jgi:hypothetical protein
MNKTFNLFLQFKINVSNIKSVKSCMGVDWIELTRDRDHWISCKQDNGPLGPLKGDYFCVASQDICSVGLDNEWFLASFM